MIIRIFNPEHDMALASGSERFTSPHAGRQLRSDLSFLPAVWSEDGDVVIVDDIDAAESAYSHCRLSKKADVEFCTLEQIPSVLASCDTSDVSIEPWGWDAAIRFQFKVAGVPETLLPSLETIGKIRKLSNRQITEKLLVSLRCGIESKTCGVSSYYGGNKALIDDIIGRECVVKTPWSSSGRGVRYLLGSGEKDEVKKNIRNWLNNVFDAQGGVMVEPHYNKVVDFAMEFSLRTDGTVVFCGLSLFDTNKGAYTGNVLATEFEKREILSSYLDLSLLDEVTFRLENELTSLLSCLNGQVYPLHLGVDMMIVAKDDAHGFLLHPCVEVNLRRTMGHASLALSPQSAGEKKMMAITYEGKKYRLKLR